MVQAEHIKDPFAVVLINFYHHPLSGSQQANLLIRSSTRSWTSTHFEHLKIASTKISLRVVSWVSSATFNASKQRGHWQPRLSTPISLKAQHNRKRHEHLIRANFQSILRHQTRLYQHLELIRPRHFTDLGFRKRTQAFLRSSNGESQSQALSQ